MKKLKFILSAVLLNVSLCALEKIGELKDPYGCQDRYAPPAFGQLLTYLSGVKASHNMDEVLDTIQTGGRFGRYDATLPVAMDSRDNWEHYTKRQIQDAYVNAIAWVLIKKPGLQDSSRSDVENAAVFGIQAGTMHDLARAAHLGVILDFYEKAKWISHLEKERLVLIEAQFVERQVCEKEEIDTKSRMFADFEADRLALQAQHLLKVEEDSIRRRIESLEEASKWNDLLKFSQFQLKAIKEEKKRTADVQEMFAMIERANVKKITIAAATDIQRIWRGYNVRKQANDDDSTPTSTPRSPSGTPQEDGLIDGSLARMERESVGQTPPEKRQRYSADQGNSPSSRDSSKEASPATVIPEYTPEETQAAWDRLQAIELMERAPGSPGKTTPGWIFERTPSVQEIDMIQRLGTYTGDLQSINNAQLKNQLKKYQDALSAQRQRAPSLSSSPLASFSSVQREVNALRKREREREASTGTVAQWKQTGRGMSTGTEGLHTPRGGLRLQEAADDGSPSPKPARKK